ncbi:MAG: hypothetical protein QXU53_06895, partial [Thermosphaera sp.]
GILPHGVLPDCCRGLNTVAIHVQLRSFFIASWKNGFPGETRDVGFPGLWESLCGVAVVSGVAALNGVGL